MKKYLPLLLFSLFCAYTCAEAFNFGLNFSFGAKNNAKYEALAPSLAWSPMSSVFGNVTTGKSKRATLYVINSGNDLAESVAITTTLPFRLVSTTTLGNISSAHQLKVTVEYTPTAAQTDTAYVNYSAPNIARTGAKLRGTGVASSVAALEWSLASHDFGNVTVSTESAHQEFTLSNTGTATATGLSLSVGNAVFRTFSSTCGDTLAASASCTVKTAFTPAVAQAYSSYLRASATGLSDLDATLTGTGVSGGASPWFYYSGSTTADCTNVANGFSTAYGTSTCNDTTHPAPETYGAKFLAGVASGVRKNFAANLDEVWSSGTIYMDGTPATGCIFVVLTDSNSADVAWVEGYGTPVKFAVRRMPGTPNYISGATTLTGTTTWYWRFHAKRDATNGELHLAVSTDGTTWTTQVNQTGINTTNTTYQYNRFMYARNAGSNLPSDWYMSSIKIYTADPGWTW